jgi:hypothetical protein
VHLLPICAGAYAFRKIQKEGRTMKNTELRIGNWLGGTAIIPQKIEFVHELQNLYYAVQGVELPLIREVAG